MRFQQLIFTFQHYKCQTVDIIYSPYLLLNVWPLCKVLIMKYDIDCCFNLSANWL